MDSDYGENLKLALLTLQDSLNELIKSTYLMGFQDGHELGLKAGGEEPNTLGEHKFDSFMNGLKSKKSNVLLEAEQILKEYS